jgi:hypothetical protein
VPLSQPAIESSRAGTLTVLGKSYPFNIAKDPIVTILRELALRHPSFLERCAQHPAAQGRKRRYIARTPEELSAPTRSQRPSRLLQGGWLVSTNINNVLKGAIIRFATEVAGLTFGKDVVVSR